MEDLNEKQIKKLRILDNKLNESERDDENLKVDLEDLSDFNIWDLEISIEDLFPDISTDEEEETEVEEDEFEDNSSEAKIVRGGGLLPIMKTPFDVWRFNKNWRLRWFDELRACGHVVHGSALLSKLWKENKRNP